MGLPKIIWVQNHPYYKHSTHTTYQRARQISEQYKKIKGTKRVRHWIIKHEKGTLFPYTAWTLYLTKIQTLT